jgi:putative transposase
MMSAEIKTINRNGIPFQGRNYYHPALYGRRHPVIVHYDLQDISSIWVFDKAGNLLCEATPKEQIHPAAAQLGTKADKEQLRQHIEQKRHQEKITSASAVSLLRNEILPEHRRQMAEIGIMADSQPIAKPSRKMISLNAEKLRREVEEQQRWQKEAEARDFRDMLLALDESDRMEKLLELEAQGVELASEWTGFMSFFEQTPAYTDYQEYWEQKKMTFSLMWRSASAGK